MAVTKQIQCKQTSSESFRSVSKQAFYLQNSWEKGAQSSATVLLQHPQWRVLSNY